jgi:hypothetical protein
MPSMGGNISKDSRPPLSEQHLRLPLRPNAGMSTHMEELFGDPAYKGFVLQDHKRLPARFFARISGALTSRLS